MPRSHCRPELGSGLTIGALAAGGLCDAAQVAHETDDCLALHAVAQGH